MRREFLLGSSRGVRDQAGAAAGDRVDAELALGTAERTLELPDALAETAGAKAAFERLSYTHRKEHARWVAQAKRDETRERCEQVALEMLRAGRTPRSRLVGYPRRVAEKPTLFVCHGDDGGPRMHPCRRVQEALRAANIDYEKVVAAHGSPIPLLRKGSREELRAATGATKLPALKLPDGTVIKHSRAILSWVGEQR